jgi:hypothetical protein
VTTRATVAAPENSGKKQARRGRFQKGQSGNPDGKPKGTRHRATQAIEALLEGEQQAIGRKLVERAIEGDPTALRLAVERLAPARRGRPVRFDLPPLEAAADLPMALGAVIAAVSVGALTPEEGLSLAQIIETRRKAIETAEIEARVAALEQRAQEEEGEAL